MPGMKIIGTGRYLPGEPVPNQALARVMDTNDEWIQQRTGIEQRHFARTGEGASDLALEAARLALADAGLQASDLDYILFNTMTPDHLFPGSGALLGAKLGVQCPALDLRSQCAAFIFSLQMAQGLVATRSAKRILVVGAEAHAGLMPWRAWDVVRGEQERPVDPQEYAFATEHRGWSIIFGDGAGAVILEATEDDSVGVQAVDVSTDGRYAHQLWVPAGFHQLPYIDEQSLQAGRHMLSMEGREIFKHAITKLPRSVRAVCEKGGVALSEVDYFIAHQANQRINDAVVDRLKVDASRAPSNIAQYGNTSGATIPILLDEMKHDGRLQSGQTLCFLALGAGIHWGSAILTT